MKLLIPFWLALFAMGSVRADELATIQTRTGTDAAGMCIIPQPSMITKADGNFALKSGVKISVSPAARETLAVAQKLADRLGEATGHLVQVRSSASSRKGTISLVTTKSFDSQLGEEGYRLVIKTDGVSITANKPAGLFYGVQTFMQLLASGAESLPSRAKRTLALPCIEIVDYPRFRWRGLLLDVSRHFFTKEEVKRFADEMSRFKFNILQLHLTDDQGWRIEINKYPRLTEIGAWRVPRQGIWWTFAPPQAGETATEGGFYTQDDIREIVAYARERFVEILPEVEAPGHAMAALASYPDLSCTGGPFMVNPGSKFYGEIENSFCPGQERTYQFLDDVAGELAALFPFQYFHMGGDEAFHGFWAKCPRCKATREKNALSNNEELQSYFVRRMEKILESHGKKLIGWDEILMGGLSPNATVMSWRGIAGGISAAKQNHDVVMTPSPFYYLDLYQGDPLLEPNTYNMSTLKMVYDFEPVPKEIDASRILGIQGNLWTESVPTYRHAQYMTWPRALAIAETAWSPAERKNWTNFTDRVEHHFKRFQATDWNYAPSMFDVQARPMRAADGSLRISLETEVEGLDIHYTFTIANPDAHYPKYVSPLSVPAGASQLRVVTCRDGRPIGRQINFPIADLDKRAAKGAAGK